MMAKTTTTATTSTTSTAAPPAFSVTQIPAIMRHANNGFTKGADLMEEWFRRPANNNPLTAVPSTTIITMSWVVGFTRAKQVYDKMIAEKMWLTTNAKKLMGERLAAQGKLLPSPRPVDFFRPFTDPVPQLDADYIQEQIVGSNWDALTLPMDDLMAALNRFKLRMVVSGSVRQAVIGNAPRHEIQIREVGIYIRDSYDFNDDPSWFKPSQPLGCWDPVSNTAGLTSASGTCVNNADFRNWRAANGMGGDFLVFSDLEIITRSPPDVFYL